jgi:hypothetical protein
MLYDRAVNACQVGLGPCEDILIVAKELQEPAFVFCADLGAYHHGSAGHIRA